MFGLNVGEGYTRALVLLDAKKPQVAKLGVAKLGEALAALVLAPSSEQTKKELIKGSLLPVGSTVEAELFHNRLPPMPSAL